MTLPIGSDKQLPALVAFAKNPETTAVKTRLAASIGQSAATQLYKAFLDDCLSGLSAVPRVKLFIACHPERSHDYFNRLAQRFGATLIDQEGADLGERMLNCVRSLSQQHSSVIITGTDVPQIPHNAISKSLSNASAWDVLIGPTSDGGYYLIGMKDAYSSLFDSVCWSTASVLEKTTQNCRALNLAVEFLEESPDIDDLKSLQALKEKIKSEAGIATATRQVLDELALL